MVSPLYSIVFFHILCLVIRNIFARVLRALATRVYTLFFITLYRRATFANFKYFVRSVTVQLNFLSRTSIFIKALRLSTQVIVVLLCCDLCNTLCAVMTLITEICFKLFFILLFCNKKIYLPIFMTDLNKSYIQMKGYGCFSIILKIIMNRSGVHFCKGMF